MFEAEPPSILRIKRKRNQDPLQALVFEEKRIKRTKSFQSIKDLNDTPIVFFKLARTDEELKDKNIISDSILMESKNKNRKVFILPKAQEIEDAEIPNELSDMINNYLNIENTSDKPQPTKLKKPSTHNNKVIIDEPIEQTEYVYDVYYRDKAVHDQYESTNIGYIRFDDEDELIDEEDDSDAAATDDEDSNAESFYQNDYPEDEDALGDLDSSFVDSEEEDELKDNEALAESFVRSDDEDDEFVIAHNRRRFSHAEYLATEGFNGNQEFDNDYDDLYDDYYDGGEGPSTFLDDGTVETNETFERNHFFKTDEDDALAIHRDKIFGKLQRMIDEE